MHFFAKQRNVTYSGASFYNFTCFGKYAFAHYSILSGCCWVIFGLLSFLRGFGRIAIRPNRVPNVCGISPSSEGAERVRNIRYDRVPNVCGISATARVPNACGISATERVLSA